jgi:hypothetical protein
MTTRRDFVIGAGSAGLSPLLPPPAAAQSAWDQGKLVHLLPTVSHDRILIKASFNTPLDGTPQLAAGAVHVRGQKNSPGGDFWQFDLAHLKPQTPYRLSLTGSDGRALCEPWTLSTFPAPETMPSRLRLLMYTCAGGHDALNVPGGPSSFLPSLVRRRLLMRGLSFKPDAIVANGDHVYWDLRAPRLSKTLGASPQAIAYAGTFDRSQPVLGGPNETVFRRAAGPQIVPLYGTLCRSTPVFFLTDDHDYFDNDEATDAAVTFPPDNFMLNLARATRRLYYPEFLPDPNRPLGLPGASAGDRAQGVGEAFGTLRYGRLAELLLYDVRRTMTLAGPTAVFLQDTVENWLRARMAARDVAHVLNIPSNPPGWSAGKWGEWYPDILGDDGRLTVAKPKPYWQPGWLKQHDRLMAAISAMPGRVPLIVSGDLHALAEGRMLRSGPSDFSKNPVVTILSGPLGTGDTLWPSAFRGIGATVPGHLEMDEKLKPLEENGFLIADFTQTSITLRFFRFNIHTQSPDLIDRLEPFRTTELKRP